MIAFLTSSLRIPSDDMPNIYALNPANNFVVELHRCLPEKKLRGLFIASSPDDYEKCDDYGFEIQEEFERAGFSFASYEILDRRNACMTKQLLQNADLVILSGGHVPTQNRFFAEIQLKACLKVFDGVLLGLSAGSMNCAEMVYAHPELPGEGISPEYKRFLPGLGITETMILPHYHAIKDDVLDGMRVLKDIAYPDSVGHKFYAIADGTYILCENGSEKLRGEAYLIENGEIHKINEIDQTILLNR